MSARFAEILLQKGVITADQLHIAVAEQLKTQACLSEILVDLQFVLPKVMGELVSKFTGYPYIDLENHHIDRKLVLSFGKEFCQQYDVMPFCFDDTLHIALLDPENVIIQDTIKRVSAEIFARPVDCKFYHTHKQALILALQQSSVPNINSSDVSFESLFNHLMNEAFVRQASDIHFVPLEQMVVAKFRIHGRLSIYQHFEWEVYEKICVRLKILAKLDIAERRRPQSGGCILNMQGSQVDCRASFHPCSWGESLVVRLLPTNRQVLSVDSLGFTKEQIKAMRKLIHKAYGLFLVCGPTGSGKTTTLHALLREFDHVKKNIMTLEQPIEYRVNGVRQTEIQENGVISFAEGIRSILRHDPDVILIGEIRDEDTAKMALRAAMTGHLVLTTMHASSPFVAPARLIDLDIAPNLLAGQILAVLNQELVTTGNGCTAKGMLVEFDEDMHFLVGDGANSARLRNAYETRIAKGNTA